MKNHISQFAQSQPLETWRYFSGIFSSLFCNRDSRKKNCYRHLLGSKWFEGETFLTYSPYTEIKLKFNLEREKLHKVWDLSWKFSRDLIRILQWLQTDKIKPWSAWKLSVFLRAPCSEPIASISFDAKNSSLTEILFGSNDSPLGFFPRNGSFKKPGNWLPFPSTSSAAVRWGGERKPQNCSSRQAQRNPEGCGANFQWIIQLCSSCFSINRHQRRLFHTHSPESPAHFTKIWARGTKFSLKPFTPLLVFVSFFYYYFFLLFLPRMLLLLCHCQKRKKPPATVSCCFGRG